MSFRKYFYTNNNTCRIATVSVASLYNRARAVSVDLYVWASCMDFEMLVVVVSGGGNDGGTGSIVWQTNLMGFLSLAAVKCDIN